MTATNPPILAGVDGSAAARQAVAWAADEAARRAVPLHLVHCYGPPPLGFAEWRPPGGWTDALRVQSGQFLADAEAYVKATWPEVVVSTEPVFDTAVPGLLDRSQHSRLLVVGSAGSGGWAARPVGVLLGSTAATVAAHAPCPVVVVRERADGAAPPAGHIVLGVDGSPVGEPAIAFAFEEASLRGAPLVAVHVWSDADDTQVFSESRWAFDFEPLREAEERVLAERLAGWQEKYPDVQVERVLVRDKPRKRLLEHSTHAQLVVVGSRGRGGFRGLLLGSTSQAMLHHAPCPVAVVRQPY